MSNLGQMAGQRQPGVPTPPKGELIARYDTYLEAQRAVDYLSDNAFPVQFVTIVGTGLRMVERVTGRLTYGRVAIAGAASGAWFGLFVGLLLSIFGSSFPTAGVFAAMIIGAAFGILFGVISYALTGGRRDFTSTSQIVASQYEVLCMPEQAGAARDLLHRLPGGTGHPSVDPAQPPGWGQPPAPSTRSGDPYAGSPYSAPPTASYLPPAGYPQPGPGGSPQPGSGAPAAELPPPVTGPTYTEMIEKQKQEREERERRGREEQNPPSAG
jgi:hypothetical protein